MLHYSAIALAGEPLTINNSKVEVKGGNENTVITGCSGINYLNGVGLVTNARWDATSQKFVDNDRRQ